VQFRSGHDEDVGHSGQGANGCHLENLSVVRAPADRAAVGARTRCIRIPWGSGIGTCVTVGAWPAKSVTRHNEQHPFGRSLGPKQPGTQEPSTRERVVHGITRAAMASDGLPIRRGVPEMPASNTIRLITEDASWAAAQLAGGNTVAHAFANFYVITTRADADTVRGVNLMKGRPPGQVGSITGPPAALPGVWDLDR